MRIGLFSDIHANAEALEAVLEDMGTQSVDTRLCLGDIVGYGADPEACLDMVRELACPTLLGNHDFNAVEDEGLERVNSMALKTILFARKRLNEEQRGYLRRLPLTLEVHGVTLVHASLCQPENWYYVSDAGEALDHFVRQTTRIAFCGHTHVPMLWHMNDGQGVHSRPGRETIEIPAEGRVLINVGSVGMPRDGDWMACYAIFDPDAGTITWRRVKYRIGEAQRKIRAASLPLAVARRLAMGC
jgi:diadenosine tetraphosphatase ApaH/serine/threonine PP2A family protein phosphatase